MAMHPCCCKRHLDGRRTNVCFTGRNINAYICMYAEHFLFKHFLKGLRGDISHTTTSAMLFMNVDHHLFAWSGSALQSNMYVVAAKAVLYCILSLHRQYWCAHSVQHFSVFAMSKRLMSNLLNSG